MLPVIWGTEALENLEEISYYIAQRNAPAAKRLKAAIERTAENLPSFPFMYRSGRIAGTREAVVHPNYILVYRVGDQAIDILAVIHARQQYP